MRGMKVTYLSECDLRVIPDDKWFVLAPFEALIENGDTVRVIVPAGFITDLASVPRFPGMYLLFGGKARKAAVLHDYLYRESGNGRAWCDAVFYEAMRHEEPGWRRAIMWMGVRLGGGFARASKAQAVADSGITP